MSAVRLRVSSGWSGARNVGAATGALFRGMRVPKSRAMAAKRSRYASCCTVSSRYSCRFGDPPVGSARLMSNTYTASAPPRVTSTRKSNGSLIGSGAATATRDSSIARGRRVTRSSERDPDDLSHSRRPEPEVRHVQRAIRSESQTRREAQPRSDHGARAVRRDARHAAAARRREAWLCRRTGEWLEHVDVALVVRLHADDRREAADRALESSVARVAEHLSRARHRGERTQLADEKVAARNRDRGRH